MNDLDVSGAFVELEAANGLCASTLFLIRGEGGLAWLSTAAANERATREGAPSPTRIVARQMAAVRKGGARAAWRATRKYDAPDLRYAGFLVTDDEIESAQVEDEELRAIRHSIARVREFHLRQLDALTQGWDETSVHDRRAYVWTMPAHPGSKGKEGQRLVPLRSVGLYVPGGKASYPSTVIMTAVPALVAGVSELMIATPPRGDGSVSPAILVAARELGIRVIAKAGGASAIALMAFGDSGCGLNPVDKVVGPGNRYVNEAKRQLWGEVGLDTFAGPSEVAVVADEGANPAYAAADWLTQVEHAEDNVGKLYATSIPVAKAIVGAAGRLLEGSPRERTMREALKAHGEVVVGRPHELVAAVNAFAPEHLTLMVREPAWWLERMENAGCILIGNDTPQSAGDFVSGPSHTLPTGRAARFGSPLNVMDFLKFQSVSALTHADLRKLRDTIETFGSLEGFPMHGRGSSIRFER
ncbi:MAG: histidinol dehydrogenase [Fimbriimonadaceae bacterium]|nr:histidinol dehydrogenase [Fimbriimonadaceae bacterium]